jgi:hypothetical protein
MQDHVYETPFNWFPIHGLLPRQKSCRAVLRWPILGDLQK